MLAVSAKDQTTGAEAHIQIQRSGRSSEAEVERMVAEAEKYRREDDERTKKVEAINDLETLISEARQIVGDLKDARKGEQLEASIEEVEAWVQQHGEEAKLTEIKLKRSKLSTAISKVSR